jgi:hypothetical protein
MDDTTVWKQFLQAVHDTVKPGTGEALQVVYPFRQWNWGGEAPVDGSYSYDQWEGLNVVPAQPGANANAQSSASRFDVGYKNWFNSLTIGDLSSDAQYRKKQDELSEAQKTWTDHIRESENVYKDQTEGGTSESYDDWLNRPENLPTKDQIEADQQTYESLATELEEYRSRTQSPVDDIVADYQNDDYYATVTEPDSGRSLKVRVWDTDPKTPWDYVYNITNQTFTGDASAGSASSLSFGHGDKQYSFSKVYGGDAFGLGVPFFGFGAAGSKGFEKVDWTRFGSNYSIEISWQDLKTVAVSPSGWYSGSNITTYGRGDNYASGFSAFKDGTANYFFGAGGSLARIYSSFVVAYRPSVTISAGQDFASYLYERWQSSNGVSIGPFFFGKETTHVKEASEAKVSNGAFSVKSNGNWPLILGYVSKWTLAPDK